MTPSPDPPSRRKLSVDELIGIFVALTSIGTIFFWSTRQSDAGFDLSSLGLVNSPSPSPVAPSPTIAPSVAASPIVAPSQPTPAASPTLPAAPASVSNVPAAALATAGLARSSAQPANASAIPPGKPTKFSDVPASYWASAYIADLTDKGIINGFSDGTFKPDAAITRAEFAEMLRKGFDKPAIRPTLSFSDIPANYWATSAIDEAVQTGFLSGYPGGIFRPNREISRLEMQLSLATGLNLQSQTPANQALTAYQDAGEVPQYAVPKIAAATETGLAVDYPDPKKLSPEKIASRAEAAALIYKALAQSGQK